MAPVSTLFYTFSQNNSGGEWTNRPDVCYTNVIVEATSADHANQIAIDKGIYFDGVSKGIDCDCCGNRWTPVSQHNGKPYPAIDGNTPLPDTEPGLYKFPAIIYYLSGHTEIWNIESTSDDRWPLLISAPPVNVKE